MSSIVALADSRQTVCVYCASSNACESHYHEVARTLGGLLADAGCALVYGGGRAGSMGALADGALARGGRVVGIIPRFMRELEWGHDELTELHVVEDMRTRKHEMLARSSAVVALAGGCGTFEELMEAITLKRLGLYLGPIVIVNTGYSAQPKTSANRRRRRTSASLRINGLSAATASPALAKAGSCSRKVVACRGGGSSWPDRAALATC